MTSRHMKLSLLWRPPMKLNKHDHLQLARWLKSYILSPGATLGSHFSIILLILKERSKFWSNSNHAKPPFFATNNHSISRASARIKSLSRRSELHGASWNLFTPINGSLSPGLLIGGMDIHTSILGNSGALYQEQRQGDCINLVFISPRMTKCLRMLQRLWRRWWTYWSIFLNWFSHHLVCSLCW